LSFAQRLDFKVLTTRAPVLVETRMGSSRGLRSSPRGVAKHRVAERSPIGNEVRRTTPPLRFAPLQRLPTQRSGFDGRVCLTRPPASSGVLNLLTLQSAPSLLALFHARSAHGVPPSEHCSSRAAVHRLQRHCPHSVSSVRSTPRPNRMDPSQCPKTCARPILKDHSVKPTELPSLPRLCSTRESVAAASGLSRREPVALLGFRPSRVLTLPDVSPAFTEPPLMRLAAQTQATRPLHYRVFPTGRLACLSRELPTLLGFLAS
jgi:hypothetical protein